MEVKLLFASPLEVADIAISKCYAKEPYSDIEKQKARINKVANVSKHSSTIEHIEFSFDIDGISRCCLQELARHRLFSFTVKSSRYTLSELREQEPFIFSNGSFDFDRASNYVVLTEDETINRYIVSSLDNLRQAVTDRIPNDVTKYCMPESYKTSLVLTGNARVLQNFFELRSSKFALAEIQGLATSMFEQIPDDYRFLFENSMQNLKIK